MAEKALELGLERGAETLADAGREYALCAMQDQTLNDGIKSDFIKRSSEYFTEALLLKPNSPYVYGHWASASYRFGSYAEAWRYVALQRQYGGQPTPQFIKLLKKKMPEPKN
jgi:Tfp pilus assembly protein PilF